MQNHGAEILANLQFPRRRYDITSGLRVGQSSRCQQAVIFVSSELKVDEVGYSCDHSLYVAGLALHPIKFNNAPTEEGSDG
jgi:hypothetical protein